MLSSTWPWNDDSLQGAGGFMGVCPTSSHEFCRSVPRGICRGPSSPYADEESVPYVFPYFPLRLHFEQIIRFSLPSCLCDPHCRRMVDDEVQGTSVSKI